MLRTHCYLEGLLCNPRRKMMKMMRSFLLFHFNGAPVEWNRQGKTEVLGEKPVPVPLCPPQTPHRPTRGRTWAFVWWEASFQPPEPWHGPVLRLRMSGAIPLHHHVPLWHTQRQLYYVPQSLISHLAFTRSLHERFYCIYMCFKPLDMCHKTFGPGTVFYGSKGKSFLCIPWRHMGSEYIFHLILNLCTRWSSGASFMPWLWCFTTSPTR
jgi:hypothetical protein